MLIRVFFFADFDCSRNLARSLKGSWRDARFFLRVFHVRLVIREARDEERDAFQGARRRPRGVYRAVRVRPRSRGGYRV